MVHDEDGRRPKLIHQLIEHFFSSLASCSDAQLESLLRVQQLAARRTPDSEGSEEGASDGRETPAVVVISSEATRDETTLALQRLAQWLHSNWEDVLREREDTGAVVIEPPTGLPPDLLN